MTVKKSAIKKMKAVSGRKAKVTVQKVDGAAAVSYTHLDVYKRQYNNNMNNRFRKEKNEKCC